jgi:hypothetical protein
VGHEYDRLPGTINAPRTEQEHLIIPFHYSPEFLCPFLRQIVTKESGFGVSGALLSGRWHNIYQMTPWQEGKCGGDDYTRLDVLANEWSGIRRWLGEQEEEEEEIGGGERGEGLEGSIRVDRKHEGLAAGREARVIKAPIVVRPPQRALRIRG